MLLLLLLRVLEGTNATLVEVDTRLQRLDSMREMLVIDFDSRDVGHETTEDLEVQSIPLRLTAPEFCLSCGDRIGPFRLVVQRVDDRLRVEQTEQPPQAIEETALGCVKRGLVDGVGAFRLGWRRVGRET